MTQNAIMDIVVAAILVLFVVNGARKGLLKSVAGLVILIVALVGAAIFAHAATPVVSKMVQPMLVEAVEKKLTEVVENIDLSEIDLSDVTLPDGVTLPEGITLPEADLTGVLDFISGTLEGVDPAAQLDALLRQLGIDPELAAGLAESALEKVESAGVSVVEALVQVAVETVVHAIVFLVAFLVLTILLKVLLGAMGLVLMLPGLRTLNSLGGAAVALAEGALVLFLLVWVARRCAVDVVAMSEGTMLFHFFVTNTPLSVLSFL